ncbi:hypothetical protein HanRHA438_Chr14g0636181 [Helianthus annuus]|uniref:Uncharacterized protein n=1 Tax=Helianthus annuus TaxID=4232 RepID=A0A9K3E702_HELAN|nr:hypothetical protein HanXRQr2_Chr14g0626211 [Helianthus annuus]KAJ0463116.1 hypothetical protein HanHA300_Chr14g0511591 [Helianthus annuus]KAJ0466941.1 hypothetical protein HanIR_Chr14g0677721 [Helianthus annuus]KAJ0484484.1 hypothetical protein HanHA89_Chr14g0544611 [Helianthus annuus]KAJ0655041.1 hypothetical protein HanLR1_Chr14g0513921 [Helianthus annuus]
MATMPKRADEELWYLQIIKNFALPREEDLSAQPPAGAVVKTPKAEPRDTADIPVSNPKDPIDLEFSPEPLLKTETGKRKQVETEAEAQPAKKIPRRKINKRGNLDAFITKPPPEKETPAASIESSSVVNADLSPSPPCAPISKQPEGSKAVEVEKSADVESEKVANPETTDVDATHPKSPEVVTRDLEKGKSIREDLKKADEIHAPVWKLKKGDTFSDWCVCRDWLQGNFLPGEIKFQEGRPHEQTYHAYLEEVAIYTSTTHRIVRECRSMHKEWAAFEASKKKSAEDEARAALLRAKLEADWAKFESDQKTEEWSFAGWKRKAEAEAALLSKERKRWREICEKDDNEKMGLRNVINNLKAEVERLKKQDADIERLKQEKADAEAACDEARSHRERSEHRKVRTCATLALKDKKIDKLTSLLSEQEQIKAELESTKKDLQLEWVEKADTSRHLVEIEEKLESSKTARVTAKSQVEPMKNDMLWLKDHRIISVANSVLNPNELDETVAHLLVAARNDGYAQGYTECAQHVVSALKVDWDTSRSATHGVDTDAALAAAKAQYNTLQLPVMDLVTVALQSEDFMTRLREVFLNREDDNNEGLE